MNTNLYELRRWVVSKQYRMTEDLFRIVGELTAEVIGGTGHAFWTLHFASSSAKAPGDALKVPTSRTSSLLLLPPSPSPTSPLPAHEPSCPTPILETSRRPLSITSKVTPPPSANTLPNGSATKNTTSHTLIAGHSSATNMSETLHQSSLVSLRFPSHSLLHSMISYYSLWCSPGTMMIIMYVLPN